MSLCGGLVGCWGGGAVVESAQSFSCPTQVQCCGCVVVWVVTLVIHSHTYTFTVIHSHVKLGMCEFVILWDLEVLPHQKRCYAYFTDLPYSTVRF